MNSAVQADIKALLGRVHQERRRANRYIAYWLASLLVLLILIPVSGLTGLLPEEALIWTALGFLTALFATPMCMLWFSRGYHDALRLLANSADVSAIGFLLDMKQQAADIRTVYAMYTALANLLPKLRMSDTGLLTDDQLRHLYVWLEDGAYLIHKQWRSLISFGISWE